MRFSAILPEGKAQMPLIVYSAMKGLSDSVKWLLAKGAGVDDPIKGDVAAPDLDGQTPLMRACLAGHSIVVRILLRAGASMARKSSTGHTALRFAAEQNECADPFVA